MPEYSNNSHKAKINSDIGNKQVDKVIKGNIQKKSKGLITELVSSFVGDKIPDLKTYAWKEALKPAILKALSDIIKNGSDILLYGEVTPKNQKRHYDRVSYSSYYEDDRKPQPDRPKRLFDCDDIYFDNKEDAKDVLRSMNALIDKYQIVSVADFYQLIGETPDFTAHNYGWTSLDQAEIRYSQNGFRIKFPKIYPID